MTTRSNPNASKSKYQPMDKTLFNLLNTDARAATIVIRLLAGLVFFAEGIKKFMFPAVPELFPKNLSVSGSELLTIMEFMFHRYDDDL